MKPLPDKLTALVRATLIALAIVFYGQDIWGVLAFANLRFRPDLPWAAPTMAVLLVVLMRYLGGAGWPRRSAETRRRLLRLNPVAPGVFIQAMIAGGLALGALGGVWLVTSDLVHLPRGLTPETSGYPLPTVVSLFVMGCVAAPLSEEAAFRGYAQGLLERAWGWAPAAVIGSSILFAAVHIPQGFDLAKLSLYFLAGLIFGTIAYLTNSLLASIAVHSLGDALGFLLLWPHDMHPHGMISEGGTDPVFWPAVTAMVVFTPLALTAFARLARMRERPPAGRPLTGLATA